LADSISTNRNYFLKDYLGSTSVLTDSTGNIVERGQYEAFGASIAATVTRYSYTGREVDPITGLFYYRARWYDSQQGRFLSEDPLDSVGNTNLYSYVNNNPVINVDPLGLLTFQVGGSFSLSGFGFTFQFGGGLAVDSAGNFGFYDYAGPGAMVGTGGFSAGASAAASSAPTICDLRGPFANYSAGGGSGPYASADIFEGYDRQGRPVIGFGETVGAGFGAGASTSVTYTGVKAFHF
jgi:RHS repeat-associated protein